MIGESIPRLEDAPLIRGLGAYADDLRIDGQIHMRIVRSPLAHGMISRIDVDEARRLPGVVAVWTFDDVAELPPIDFRQVGGDQMLPFRQRVLASDRVRYVGEPIAAVFAVDPYIAEDAADLVSPWIEELAPLLDIRGPLGQFDETHTTDAWPIREAVGDIDAAFKNATHTVEIEVSIGRHSGIPMECRGALAVYHESTQLLEVLGAAKVPHYNARAIASMLGLADHQVVLREGHVGGGFGIRGELYPEDVLVSLAAIRLGQPVKWIEDRQEHLVAANHSRDQHHLLRAAVDGDGFITGLDVEFWLDQGAYVRTHGATVPTLTAAMLPGPYQIPAYRVTGHVRLSNKTPAGTYRAPGRYEGTFARERLLDEVARVTGLDPAEVRRRNLITEAQMPYERGIDALGTAVVYDSGRYELMLDRVLGHLQYDTLRDELNDRRDRGELVGLGFGFFVEKSGLGPYAGAKIDVDHGGHVRIITGAASVGQGMETVVAQVAADVLGVAPSSMTVVHGQTDQIAYGLGAFASRVTVMTGSATTLAAEALKLRAIDVAADLLEANPTDLELVGGEVRVKGTPSRLVSLGQIAQELTPGTEHAEKHGAGLTAEEWFKTTHMTYPYGLHVAVVKVDPDTGRIEFERYVVAYDVGRAINPMLVEGQIMGGAAQGLGGAILEEFLYSDTGQPIAASFMDYLLPTVAEVPSIEILLSEDAPSPLNPLGVKGAGEGGTTAFGAAAAAAVDDAIGGQGSVRVLPMTPERVKALLRPS